jgi:hypothetical protein
MLKHHLADHSSQPRGNPDLDGSEFAFLRMARDIGGVNCLDDELARLFKKGVAGLGKFHLAFVTREERDPQVFFQLADLPAQGRLRDVQLLSSLAEVEAFRDRDEVSCVTQFHGDVFYTGSVFRQLLSFPG